MEAGDERRRSIDGAAQRQTVTQ
ncbi:hypothetical protein A2U01_0089917, partial [Trifolium medium]|nr:hypothetical protein [Trifolium medium]